MEDKTLLAIAVATSLLGVCVLWYGAVVYEPRVYEVSEVSDEMIGQVVAVEGIVRELVAYNQTIKAVFEGSDLELFGFKSVIQKIEEGQRVKVIGEIKEYKGAVEIVPRKPGDVVVLAIDK